MCTNIVVRSPLTGSGKGQLGWFPLAEVAVSYDHPFDIPLEYAVNLDFTNAAAGASARVAVELTLESARTLVSTLLSAIGKAEEYEAG